MKESSAEAGDHKNINTTNLWIEEVQVSGSPCFRCWSNQTYTEKCYLIIIISLIVLFILMTSVFIFLSIEGEIIFIRNTKSDVCLKNECVKVAAHILERIDGNVEPCQDFYEFSCGNFIHNNPIPDDNYLKNFLQQIQDEVYFEMKSYLEKQLTETDGKAVQQIKLLYNSCMNESNSNDEKKAMSAVFAIFDQIGGQWALISDEKPNQINLELRLSSLLVYQVQPFFQVFIEPDQQNRSHYAIHLLSGTTVLESNYFTVSDDSLEMTEEINAYIELQMQIIQTFLKFKGIQRSDTELDLIRKDIIEMVRFEADLSKITKESANEMNTTSMSDSIEDVIKNEENYLHLNSSNVQNMFIKSSLDKLEEIYESIKWKILFENYLKIAKVKTNDISINSKEYLTQLMKLIDNYSPKTIDNYLCWTFIARYLPYLGPHFRRLFSEFRSKVPDLSTETGDPNGSSRIFLSRWKECVHVVSEGMEVPAIALYLQYKRQTLNSIIDKINEIINKTKNAFNSIIDSQEWIDSDEIKTNLKDRVTSIDSKIGVPKFLNNQSEVDKLYRRLDIDSEDVLIANIFKMTKHQTILQLEKLNDLVDLEEEWVYQPLIANAFYDYISNNIIMPPGIIRFPLISSERPGVLDFATLGIVIGHEIAHSMGSDSRKFMKYSNDTNWWTNDMNYVYKEKAKCFAKQYSGYLVESTDEYLNGNHTLEENICDFAGLQQSYTAYKQNSEQNPLRLPGLTNYNYDQLFFIQYAQLWCEVVSEEGHRKSLHDDHSPGRYRANGVLVNSLQFAKAFDCPEGCPMNPKDKCHIWNSNQL